MMSRSVSLTTNSSTSGWNAHRSNASDGWNTSDWNWNEVVRDFKDGFSMHRKPHVAVVIAAYVIVFPLSLLGNGLVLVVFRSKRSLRSVTNYFFVNLSVADLLVAVVCVPFTVGELIYPVWPYGEILCKTTGYLQGVSICASVMTIMFLSLERYLAIQHPVSSRPLLTVRHVIVVIVVIWAVSAAIMVPLAVFRRLRLIPLRDSADTLVFCHETWPSRRSRRIFDVALFVFVYVIPGTVVVCSYLATGRRLLSRDKSLGCQDTGVYHRLMAGRRRIAVMLLLVAALFAVSWLPYYTVTLYVAFARRSEADASLTALPFALLLGHSHSAQNPVLYWIINKSFRRGVVDVLRCRRQDAAAEYSHQQKFDRHGSRNNSERRSGSSRRFLHSKAAVPTDNDTAQCRL